MYQRVNNLRKLSFHPLKAGRRLVDTEEALTEKEGFHPLKAGRRQLSELSKRYSTILSFHPLKAGRRR